MYDIRLHGRGGQGAVICGNMLAAALAEEGKYALSFPLFAGDSETPVPVGERQGSILIHIFSEGNG